MKEILLRNKKAFIIYVLASTLFVEDVIVSNIIFSNLVGLVQTKNMGRFYLLIGLMAGQAVLGQVLFVFSRFKRIGFMKDTILYIRNAAFDTIITKSYRSFNRKLRSEYISNLVNDINNFENGFFYSILNIIFLMTTYFAALLILLFMDWRLALMMLALSVAVYWINRLFQKKTVAMQAEVQKSSEHFTVSVSNTFSGLEILKLNRIEDRFLHNTMREVDMVEKKKFRFAVFTYWQRKFSFLIGTIVFILLLVYVLSFMMEGADLARIFFTVTIANSMIWPITEAMPLMNEAESHAKVVERILSKDVEDGTSGTEPFNFCNAIEANSLSFYYGDRMILKDASFKLMKGRKYLIKGASGAGKSTLMNLLPKVAEPSEGVVLVDGTDLCEISEKSFNEKASFVYQDVFLFEDTIRNNIALYKPYTDEEIMEAARGAGLESFISSKANGLDEVIEENGKNISGGERQRISIARAIIRKPDILFADEITSALDETLGRLVEDTMLSLDTTVVAVSHRFYPGVTEKYDHVIEIVNGKVREMTTSEYLSGVES